ncbi:MAG: DNA repair protein RadC [Verrucomicrobiota bacterium]
MLIKELPEDERPRERIAAHGAEPLSDAEILAVFFGTGRQGLSAVELGRELMSRFGSLRNLSRASVAELTTIDGIGPAKAAQLAAVFEFGRRLSREAIADLPVTSPEEVYALVGASMQCLSQESVRVILLNHRKHLIKVEEVFVGTGNESFANPPEILRRAISHAAHSLILVHNHPTGDPTPSHADREVTRRMEKACRAVGIEFLDHMIIGAESSRSDREPYFSFREAGLL